MQKDIANLAQTQVLMQTQHQDQLQQIVKELNSLKTQLQQNSQARRPNIAEVTRKKNLSPIARRLYDNNIKTQAQNRRMKRVIKRLKQQNVNDTVTLERRIENGQKDGTTKIRENFMNMILRNNDVPSQVM